MALETLDAASLRSVVETYRDVLQSHRDELNRLNVYPVPDGDTGTNMLLTIESVLEELEGAESLDDVCQGVSHGSLMGARGNSGVILSQILRGLASTFSSADSADSADSSADSSADGIDGPRVAEGLHNASDAAYDAVMRPVEGTILTVVRETAEAAKQACDGDAALVAVLDAAKEAAEASLARTPELLPVLKEAGVVDAGAKGFVLFIDTVLNVVDERPVPEPESIEAPPEVRAHLEGDGDGAGGDVSSLRYEVMYILEADDEKVPSFKDAWAVIGDSIVVVGGDGLWNCHVHTDQIGSAIEAGIQVGRPRNIRVTDLADQVEEEAWVREHTRAVEADGAETAGIVAGSSDPVSTAVVAVAVGAGLQRLFTGLGANRVVAGGQTMNPSTKQILQAVEACPAEHVIVLPNNKNIVPVAREVDALTEKRVEVVSTTSVVEGLSSLISYDPHADLRTNVAAIAEAAQRVKTGEVTQAVRDAPSDFGDIKEGAWIALDREGIRAVEESAGDAAFALIDHLVDEEDELVTIVIGAAADETETEGLRQRLAEARPELEIELQDGGQPLYPYVIGIE